jgi:hypothetical protein
MQSRHSILPQIYVFPVLQQLLAIEASPVRLLSPVLATLRLLLLLL